MDSLHVLTLVGGISSTSINKRLYTEIQKRYKGTMVFEEFDISSLPYYSQDIENNAPVVVKTMREMAQRADGILLITPEYNRSVPGVLKNAIDWGSRPYGDNCWNNKPAAVMGASIGAIGTFGAQQHLRNICSFVNMHVLSQPEFYFNASVGMTEDGLTESGIKLTQKFLDRFETWIKKLIQ